MRLSTKSRYAVTSLLDMILHSAEGSVSLSDISIRQGISLSYLEQLFAKMRRNDLVISSRGPGGGYCLKRDPEQVCIADVISAVDEDVHVTNQDAQMHVGSFEPYLTEQLWKELSAEIRHYLTTISLADVIQNEEVIALSQNHDLRQIKIGQ